MGWLIGIIEFCILAYLFVGWNNYKEQAQTKEKEIKQLNQRLNSANGSYQRLIKKYDALYIENKELFRHAIYIEVKHSPVQKICAEMSFDEITDMILRNPDYVQIKSIQDLSNKDMKKVIKSAWCADHGLLDYYQNPEVFDNKLFRIAQNGDYILLTQEEIESIDQKNFDFILEEIE